MRKRFYTLLALSLLSTVILSVSCNKDKIDFGGGSDPNSISQVTTGSGAPTAGQKGDYYFEWAANRAVSMVAEVTITLSFGRRSRSCLR